MPLVNGTRLGPYEILALVGSGGMGEVYRAHDPRLHRDVAIKILKEGHLSSADALLRFEREARAIASLNHPHIATLHDIGEHDDTRFLVMEYLAGQSLAVRLASGPLALADALRYAAQTADALDHAHQVGVVHRDLKPANILLTAQGAKLLDFGLAKAIAVAETAATEMPLTERGAVVGTYQYMAPEQFEGREAISATDIFALGAVLFEMITGRKAFPGSTMPRIAAAVLHDVPRPVSQFQPQASGAVDRIVRKCMAKDPEQRWPSAGALRDKLRSVRVESDRRAQTRMEAPSASVAAPSSAHGLWRIRGVAVLPLRNLSGQAAEDYFVDGMTESLITSLAKVGAMKVIARSSVMGYKGSSKPLRQIAKELKVDTILEGSITRSRDRVGINLQLVRVTTDSPIWAEQYNRDFSDVLEVQSEVAQAVADAIKITVTPTEKLRLETTRKVAREAYDEYLKGQFARRRATREGLAASFEHFTHAIALDPHQASSHVGLAMYYDAAGLYRLIPYQEAFSSGRHAALRAIALDPALGAAYGALGALTLHEWDLAGAQRAFVQAVQLDPNDSLSRQEYAKYLMYLGRLGEAIAQVEHAEEIDPRAPGPCTMGAFVSYTAGDFTRAISWADRAIELAFPSPPAQYVRGLALAQLAQWDQALETMTTAVDASGQHPSTVAGLAYLYARRGMTDEATGLIRALEERHRSGEATSFDLAEAYVGSKQHDRAFEALEQAFNHRVPELIGVAADPIFADLREMPAFRDLVSRIGVA
jgi:serine/threonine protein kinase/tetratricopeptide (TPR) repeat protein